MFTDLDFVRLLLYLPTEVRASQPPSRHRRAPRILPRTTNYQYCYYRISESLLLPLLPPLSATAIDYHYYRLLPLLPLPNVTSSCETKKNKTKTKKTIHGIQKSRKRERMKQKTKIKQSSYKSSCNLARRGTHLKLYV